MSNLKAIALHGVKLHVVTERQAIESILDALDESRGGWVITINLDILRRLSRDAEFAGLCEGTTLRVADGMPLVWASRLQGTPLPERVAGSAMTLSLTESAAQRGRSIYLCGGVPGVNEKAANVMVQKFPGLKIAGMDCPAFGFEKDEAQIQAIIARLVEARPDIVYVALGSPKQEQLIRRMIGAWPGAWYVGVGISFSFVAGDVKRAPQWMQKVGLEWVHRLVQEPRRLAKRYLVDGLPFAGALLIGSLLARFRRTASAG